MQVHFISYMVAAFSKLQAILVDLVSSTGRTQYALLNMRIEYEYRSTTNF